MCRGALRTAGIQCQCWPCFIYTLYATSVPWQLQLVRAALCFGSWGCARQRAEACCCFGSCDDCKECSLWLVSAVTCTVALGGNLCIAATRCACLELVWAAVDHSGGGCLLTVKLTGLACCYANWQCRLSALVSPECLCIISAACLQLYIQETALGLQSSA